MVAIGATWEGLGWPGDAIRNILASLSGGSAFLLRARLPDWEAWDP